ncbi:MAG: hypothetical protein SFX74_08485 [Fimbriimonadaceae bacterium]|nr:hypothetical protein [Fimbriimonadaceae bacterium]
MEVEEIGDAECEAIRNRWTEWIVSELQDAGGNRLNRLNDQLHLLTLPIWNRSEADRDVVENLAFHEHADIRFIAQITYVFDLREPAVNIELLVKNPSWEQAGALPLAIPPLVTWMLYTFRTTVLRVDCALPGALSAYVAAGFQEIDPNNQNNGCHSLVLRSK